MRNAFEDPYGVAVLPYADVGEVQLLSIPSDYLYQKTWALDISFTRLASYSMMYTTPWLPFPTRRTLEMITNQQYGGRQGVTYKMSTMHGGVTN